MFTNPPTALPFALDYVFKPCFDWPQHCFASSISPYFLTLSPLHSHNIHNAFHPYHPWPSVHYWLFVFFYLTPSLTEKSCQLPVNCSTCLAEVGWVIIPLRFITTRDLFHRTQSSDPQKREKYWLRRFLRNNHYSSFWLLSIKSNVRASQS